MGFKFHPIGGMCLGVEYLWGLKILAIDLLIVRIYIYKKRETKNDNT